MVERVPGIMSAAQRPAQPTFGMAAGWHRKCNSESVAHETEQDMSGLGSNQCPCLMLHAARAVRVDLLPTATPEEFPEDIARPHRTRVA